MSSAPSVADVGTTDSDSAGACAVCPHALAAHDRISLRFCQATRVQGAGADATRGCACPS